jgi:serine phosphatase RsbU (regulator of sigma subunit)
MSASDHVTATARGEPRAQPVVLSGVTGRHRAASTAASILLLLAAFLCDWLTGSEVASSLFYVIVIMFGAWFAGRGVGLVLSLLSVMAWEIAHQLTGVPFSKASVLYWNLLAELAIYVITALAVAQTRNGLDRVHALAARLEDSRRALDQETRAVGDLQLKLLPKGPPRLPGYAWEIVYLTSTRAGGDYYDFFPLPDGRTVVLVADASGHGAPAAVLMAMTRVLLHTAAGLPERPDRLLARLNDQLAGALPSAWFVTACVAVIEPASGRIEYSLGGHPAPWIVRAAGRTAECLASLGGPPLGAFAGSGYHAGTAVLAPGETLVLHTDGLTEAMSPELELFGESRLSEALQASHDGDLAGMRRALLARIDDHRRGAPLSDDLTLLLLRRAEG